MGLLSCEECEAHVSDRASRCPQCGFPLKHHECPDCNAPVAVGDVDCEACGAPMGEQNSSRLSTRWKWAILGLGPALSACILAAVCAQRFDQGLRGRDPSSFDSVIDVWIWKVAIRVDPDEVSTREEAAKEWLEALHEWNRVAHAIDQEASASTSENSAHDLDQAVVRLERAGKILTGLPGFTASKRLEVSGTLTTIQGRVPRLRLRATCHRLLAESMEARAHVEDMLAKRDRSEELEQVLCSLAIYSKRLEAMSSEASSLLGPIAGSPYQSACDLERSAIKSISERAKIMCKPLKRTQTSVHSCTHCTNKFASKAALDSHRLARHMPRGPAQRNDSKASQEDSDLEGTRAFSERGSSDERDERPRPIARSVEVGEVRYGGLRGNVFVTAQHHLLRSPRRPAVRVSLTNMSDLPQLVRVEAELEGFSSMATTIQELPAKAFRRVVSLTPTYSDRLRRLEKTCPGTIVVRVRDRSGDLLFERRKSVSLASRNDKPSGNLYSWATFVTPDAPVVDALIGEARRYTPGRAFLAYQGSSADVRGQVKALYLSLIELGVGYRSATGRLSSGQKVYYPQESLTRSGANCVDGSVLFASALEKLTIRSALVLVPGHMFLAFALDPEGKSWDYLETTLVGTASFSEALSRGRARFRRSSAKDEVEFLEIREARRLGFTPFPIPPDKGQRFRFARSRVYFVSLDEVRVDPRDHPKQEAGDGAPELYVQIVKNQEQRLLLDTSPVAPKDSWVALFGRPGPSCRVEVSRGDVVSVYVFDKDLSKHDLLESVCFGLPYESFLGREAATFKTPAGSVVRLRVREE